MTEDVAALVQRLLDEVEQWKAQAEYERNARVAANDFPRNRHGHIPCERCGIDSGLDAILDDEVWALIAPVPECPEAGVLCLWCMDELLAEKGVKARATLFFRGKALSHFCGS